MKIKVKDGEFETSARHNLAIGDMSYRFAEEAEELFGLGKVESVEKVRREGIFAPKTVANNYFVYIEGDSQKKVLAHCYSNVRNPEKIDFIVDKFESAWRLFDDGEKEDVHPSHKWL